MFSPLRYVCKLTRFQWEITPPPTQLRHAPFTLPSPSPPPPVLTQPRHGRPAEQKARLIATAPAVSKAATPGKVAVRRGKTPKKTAVDRFQDNRQDETRRLDLKRKMLHDEKMAAIHSRNKKYELRYGSRNSSSSSPRPASEAESAADKQILILRLKIQLAELTRSENSSSRATPLLPSTPLASGGVSPQFAEYSRNLDGQADPMAANTSVTDYGFTFPQVGAVTNSMEADSNWQVGGPSYNFN